MRRLEKIYLSIFIFFWKVLSCPEFVTVYYYFTTFKYSARKVLKKYCAHNDFFSQFLTLSRLFDILCITDNVNRTISQKIYHTCDPRTTRDSDKIVCCSFVVSIYARSSCMPRTKIVIYIIVLQYFRCISSNLSINRHKTIIEIKKM